MFIPVMTQHYAMLQQNLLYTGHQRTRTDESSARLPPDPTALVLIARREDDVPTIGTRKEYHSRRTNSVCATKAEGLTPSYLALPASARGGAAVHRRGPYSVVARAAILNSLPPPFRCTKARLP